MLDQLDCADDSGIAAIKKDIADAEASLSKLEQQEKKYSAQLEAALNEYTNLKVRGADFDAAELYAQRMILRADIMAAAVDHVQAAYGEKYDSVMMFNSKRDVSALIHDEDKCRAYEQKSSQKKQQEHGDEQKEKYKHPEQE